MSMIVLVDVGNSNIVFGFEKDRKIKRRKAKRIQTLKQVRRKRSAVLNVLYGWRYLSRF